MRNLYIEETLPNLKGLEKVQQTEFGAVNVLTGIFTGRSPKDKYIVKDQMTEMICGGHQRQKKMTINL